MNNIPYIVEGPEWQMPGDDTQDLDGPYVPDFTQEFKGEFNSGMNGVQDLAVWERLFPDLPLSLPLPLP